MGLQGTGDPMGPRETAPGFSHPDKGGGSVVHPRSHRGLLWCRKEWGCGKMCWVRGWDSRTGTRTIRTTPGMAMCTVSRCQHGR